MNWGCHPTTEGMQNRRLSADWVGAYYAKMEYETDGTPMFVNASVGAAIQPNTRWRDRMLGGDAQGFRWAKAMGETLADQVLGLLESGMREAAVDEYVIANARVTVPMMNGLYRFASNMGMTDLTIPEVGTLVEVPLTFVSLGPVRIATMPGEMAPHIGQSIREIVGGEAQVLVGLGQDWTGYIIDPMQYADETFAYEKMLCMSPTLGVEVLNAYQAIEDALAESRARRP
ncbi:MAG: hypothetical protein M5R36_13005 [Deltaproteobacteria bacterium]|nr:hypothetical protein [Deltaproteobacteria bacterium]